MRRGAAGYSPKMSAYFRPSSALPGRPALRSVQGQPRSSSFDGRRKARTHLVTDDYAAFNVGATRQLGEHETRDIGARDRRQPLHGERFADAVLAGTRTVREHRGI